MRVSSRYLQRTLRKSSILIKSRGSSLDTISQKLKVANADYYKIKGSDKALRSTAQENLAEAIAQEGSRSKEKILKDIRHRENQRSKLRKIRYLRGKINMGSKTIVTNQIDNGSFKDLKGKHKIKEAIFANNQAKYQQSFHTPFLQSPLREEFGFKGLTTASQAVLGGVYETDSHIDQFMKAFIEELILPQAVRDLGPQLLQLSLASFLE
jgi:hypothetical protein